MIKYGSLTQGSIINNIRISKYPDEKFFGIIVTARCDIANCKVSKFYYLLALPVDRWIETEGVKIASEQLYDKKLKSALSEWEGIFPDYENLLNKSIYKIISEIKRAKKGEEEKEEEFSSRKERSLKLLESIKKYSNDRITKSISTELLADHEIKSAIKKILPSIMQDSHSHYCFIPRNSYDPIESNDTASVDLAAGSDVLQIYYEGLIINLLEIDSIDYKTADKIEKQELDYTKLTRKELSEYNSNFFLENKLDIIFPEKIISSPYIEWVMQRFSQAFIRIGIEKPNHKQITRYWEEKFNL